MRHFITLLTLFVAAAAAQSAPDTVESSSPSPAKSPPQLQALARDVNVGGIQGIGIVDGNNVINRPIFNFGDSPTSRLIRQVNALLDQIKSLLGQISSPLPPGTPGAGLVIRTLVRVRAILINALTQLSSILNQQLYNDVANILNETIEILGLAADKLGVSSSEISREINSVAVIAVGSGVEAVPALLQGIVQIIIGIVIII